MTDQRPKKKRGDFAPALEADLPVSLLAHRAEIGDQGCYLLHLLYRPNNKPLKTKHLKAEDGWRALQSVELNPYLGQCRVNGKQTYRLSLLLGTRENPGLLERLGLVERDRLYSAGHFCMHWRLTYRDRTGATERVRLVVKPTRRPWSPPATQPEAGKPAPAKGKGKRSAHEGLTIVLISTQALERLGATGETTMARPTDPRFNFVPNNKRLTPLLATLDSVEHMVSVRPSHTGDSVLAQVHGVDALGTPGWKSSWISTYRVVRDVADDFIDMILDRAEVRGVRSNVVLVISTDKRRNVWRQTGQSWDVVSEQRADTDMSWEHMAPDENAYEQLAFVALAPTPPSQYVYWLDGAGLPQS